MLKKQQLPTPKGGCSAFVPLFQKATWRGGGLKGSNIPGMQA